jgi:nucleoid-associated protein YgaU
MTDRSSRFRAAPTYRLNSGSREVELYQPREIPLTLVSSKHRVGGDERLDAIAHRYYSDPFQYWRIADANPSEAPDDLLESGRSLLMPVVD